MDTQKKSTKMDIIYFSHGGGPLPLLDEISHREMVNFLQSLSSTLTKPEAIVVFSAHWEEAKIAIIGKNNPSLFYDYYAFPEETYSIHYPIKGDSQLIDEIQVGLAKNSINSYIELDRGYDHGVFVPLKIMYPDAKIPVIQISLKKGLNPEYHILLGRAMKEISQKKLLIIGSGFSFHNMHEFNIGSAMHKVDAMNDEFQDWLIKICTENDGAKQTFHNLISWETAPHARYCHPREEHLIPLHVCFGASTEQAHLIFDGYIAGKRSIALHWQNS